MRVNPVYDIGDLLEMLVTVKSAETGDLFGPATVVFTFKDGDGTTSTPDVENPSVGIYRAFALITAEGSGAYAFDALDEKGRSLGVEEEAFRIRKRLVPR